MLVILQTAGEEVAHKVDDFIVKIRGVALLNGRIIFINDNNCFAAMMLTKEQRKSSQGRFKIHGTCIALSDLTKQFLFIGIQLGTGFEFNMPLKFLRNQLADFGKGLLPGGIFHIFEGKEYNGILALIGGIFFTALPDQFILKVFTGILVGLFKEDT